MHRKDRNEKIMPYHFSNPVPTFNGRDQVVSGDTTVLLAEGGYAGEAPASYSIQKAEIVFCTRSNEEAKTSAKTTGRKIQLSRK
jgi:hypothetical protein